MRDEHILSSLFLSLMPSLHDYQIESKQANFSTGIYNLSKTVCVKALLRKGFTLIDPLHNGKTSFSFARQNTPVGGCSREGLHSDVILRRQEIGMNSAASEGSDGDCGAVELCKNHVGSTSTTNLRER